MSKRRIEVFTSNCHVCEDTVKMVKELACPSCEVVIYDLSNPCESRECIEKSKSYGITSVPAVVIDGKLAECCKSSGPDRDALVAAGLGRSL